MEFNVFNAYRRLFSIKLDLFDDYKLNESPEDQELLR